MAFLKKGSFLQWKKILLLKKKLLQTSESFFKLKSRLFLGKVLSEWRLSSHFLRINRQKTQKLTIWFVKSRKFKQWRKALKDTKDIKEKQAFMERTGRKRLLRKVLKGLKVNKYIGKRMRKNREFLERKGEIGLLIRVFNGFREILDNRRLRIDKVLNGFI